MPTGGRKKGFKMMKTNCIAILAAAIATPFVVLAHGVRVEVRPVAEECPIAAEAHAHSQIAEANA